MMAEETSAGREAEKLRANGGAEEISDAGGAEKITTGGGSREVNAGGGVEEQKLVDPAGPEDLPECPICNEAFQPQRPATLLGCGHMLCSRCLAAMTRKKELLRCPFCRRTTELRLDHQAVSIIITGQEQRAQYSSLLHKLLGCCVYAPPWTPKGMQLILLLLLLGCLLYMVVPLLVLAFS